MRILSSSYLFDITSLINDFDQIAKQQSTDMDNLWCTKMLRFGGTWYLRKFIECMDIIYVLLAGDLQ